jgi:hypothetical protein
LSHVLPANAVTLLVRDNHVCVAGTLNSVPCYFIVDTGGYVTTLNVDFTARAKLKVTATSLVGEGFGVSSPVGITTFPSLRIGNHKSEMEAHLSLA